jgi:predicted metal-dependent phosphoesterase TrpH
MKKINFHFHTIYSDGKKTVEQIAELVNKDGLDYLAITDHDTVNAIDKLKPLLKSTELINGIELTAQVRDNLIFHILGIGFDHKKMLKHLEAYGKKYNEEYQFYFDKFTKEKNIVDISTDKHKVKSA